MTSTREKVLAMVESGKVTPEQGTDLIRALQPQASSTLFRRLLNPFERIQTGVGLAITAAGMVAALAITQLGIRFDGALDLHRTPLAPPMQIALLEQLLAIGLTAALFWGSAFAFGRGGRLVDYLVAVGIARIPYLLGAMMAVLLIPNPPSVITDPAQPQLILAGLLTLPLIVWSISLMVAGVRNASGLRGSKLAGSFIIALLLAEALSKLALHLV